LRAPCGEGSGVGEPIGTPWVFRVLPVWSFDLGKSACDVMDTIADALGPHLPDCARPPA